MQTHKALRRSQATPASLVPALRASVSVILALGICGGISGVSSSAGEAEPLKVIALRGHAFVTTEEGSPRPLSVGETVSAGSEIRTGPRSTLDLEGPAPANIRMRLDANSRVRLALSSRMELGEGDAFLKLPNRRGASVFELKTPTVVASVRGAVFRVRHIGGRTSVYVSEGEVELTDAKNADRHIRVADKKIEDYAGGAFPPLRHLTSDDKPGFAVFISDSPIESGGARFKVRTAEESYYIVPSCRTEDNVSVCSDGDGEKEPDYEDYRIWPGDAVGPPFRAFLNRPESRIEMDLENVRYVFEGIMVICVERDPPAKKIKVKLFQTVGLSYEIRREKDKTTVRAVSRNESGLKNSTVRVTEGRVGVKTPWLCEGCRSTKTFIIDAGECLTFRFWTPPSPEMEIPVNLDPPDPRDRIGSEDKLR